MPENVWVLHLSPVVAEVTGTEAVTTVHLLMKSWEAVQLMVSEL